MKNDIETAETFTNSKTRVSGFNWSPPRKELVAKWMVEYASQFIQDKNQETIRYTECCHYSDCPILEKFMLGCIENCRFKIIPLQKQK